MCIFYTKLQLAGIRANLYSWLGDRIIEENNESCSMDMVQSGFLLPIVSYKDVFLDLIFP